MKGIPMDVRSLQIPVGWMSLTGGNVTHASASLLSWLGCADVLNLKDLQTDVFDPHQPRTEPFTDRWQYGNQSPVYMHITPIWHADHMELWIENAGQQNQEKQQLERELQHLLRLNAMVADISTRMLLAHPETSCTAIQYGLEQLGTLLDASRAYIFLFDDQDTLNKTFVWRAKGMENEKWVQQVNIQPFPVWLKTLQEGQLIMVPDVHDLPANMRSEQQVLLDLEIHSVMLIPLRQHQQTLGFLGFDRLREPKDWSEQSISALQMFGQAVTHNIHRREQHLLVQKYTHTLDTLIQNLPVGILYEDDTRHVKVTNQAMMDMFGMPFPPAALIGTDCVEGAKQSAQYMQSPEAFLKRIEKIVSDEQTVLQEPVVFQDGRTLERSFVPVRSNDQLTGYLWLYQDITPRLQQEKALKEYHHMLESLFAASPDMIVTWALQDGELYTQLISPSVNRIAGHNAQELGKLPYSKVLQMVHPEDQALAASRMQDLLDGTAEQHQHRMRFLDHTGEYLPAEVHSRPIEGQDGKVHGVVSILRDIRMQLDQENQLLLATERAENANAAKSRFLSRMSHELRTPLNAILASAQMLQMRGLEKPQERGVGRILNAGRHLLSLIDDILDLSRIETGNLNITLQDVYPYSVMEEALDMVRQQAEVHQIQLEMELSELPRVRTDQARLRQILVNLLTNAIKYNHAGGRVKLYPERFSGFLRLHVQDTGIGISDEHKQRVFMPFERFGSMTESAQGTGIGLALSRTLAEHLHARMGFESTLHEGSDFYIDLPLAEQFDTVWVLACPEFCEYLHRNLPDLPVKWQSCAPKDLPELAPFVLNPEALPGPSHWMSDVPEELGALKRQLAERWNLF
ncbi:ATP-binding protein [Deinococcus misasensis]|uniref:ATP-binding protein n=1 Tax=Deinococcus misasensis TaxID=392413 RepID=UPI00069190CE|nr:ATP-binding protein [Deinococcus misasensis]